MLDLTVGLAGVEGRETGPSGTSVEASESTTWSSLNTSKSNVVETDSIFWRTTDPGVTIGELRRQGRQV